METNLNDALLLIVDVQQGLDHPKFGVRNNPQAEQNMARLLKLWRGKKRPLIHIQHLSTEPNSPLRPELPGVSFKPEVQPLDGETIIQKSVNSAFIGTNLQAMLDEQGIDTLVIVGLTTDHCISTTARMAGNLGYKTFVVSDATATFPRIGYNGRNFSAEDIHDITLTSLHKEFAEVVSTEQVLHETILVVNEMQTRTA
jgi:nicotinamidase-related amidase